MSGAVPTKTSWPSAVGRGVPPSLLVRAAGHLFVRALRGKVYLGARPEEEVPWISPDVWKRVVDYYRALDRPTVFEWGTGTSSIWHLRALLERGGTYVGVEHNVLWFMQMVASIARDAARMRVSFDVEWRGAGNGFDAAMRLGPAVDAVLRFRPRHRGAKGGDEARYASYVEALDRAADLVVIDGRARRACVRRALDTAWLKTGGLLVLFEAGRGDPTWFDTHQREGKLDYRREVEEMVRLGGQLVDGMGLDRWDGLTRRRTLGPHALGPYLREACILVR